VVQVAVLAVLAVVVQEITPQVEQEIRQALHHLREIMVVVDQMIHHSVAVAVAEQVL
jgi:hypothetical protein